MEPMTDVKVKLLGEDGNAFYILGKVSKALREAGYSEGFIGAYQQEAKAGDYDHLLMVAMQYVDVE